MADILSLDGPFLDPDLVAAARESRRQLDSRVAACQQGRAQRSVECFLDVLFGPGGVRGRSDPSEPLASTASATLVHGAGTCAALVAVALDLAARHRVPLVAAVFEAHVLLAYSRRRDRFFETLDGGRFMSAAEAQTRFGRGGRPPRIVPSTRYAAFYLDNLAARWHGAGDTTRARRAFEQAVALAPREGRIQYNYGTFLLESRDYAAAFSHLDVAARRLRTHPGAWLHRGLALRALGREQEARRSLERVLDLDPSNVTAVHALGDPSGNTDRPRGGHGR